MTDNTPMGLTEAEVRELLGDVKFRSDGDAKTITDLARTLLASRAELDTAKAEAAANFALSEGLAAQLAGAEANTEAAVALVVEQAADALDAKAANYEAEDNQTFCGPIAVRLRGSAREIRALATASGLAVVQELRAEIDRANGVWQANLRLIAERDTLAAELAASRAREKGLREALITNIPSHRNPSNFCWCPASHDPGYGHTTVCLRNRAALAQAPDGEATV